LHDQGFFTSSSAQKLAGAHPLDMTAAAPYTPPWRTATSVAKIRALIAAAARQRVFSLVVPAHNESQYLAATLTHLAALDYPRDLFEVIVVENGSTDDTPAVARSFMSRFPTDSFKVLESPQGVSRAKNVGLAAVRADTDWIVFLDADTHLAPAFLYELDQYLRTHRRTNLAVGTTAVRPWGRVTAQARRWFAFYDWGHRLTASSFAIHLMRADLRASVRFDEARSFGEDLRLTKTLRRHGAFFFLTTDTVSTSTRRFDHIGYWRLFMRWLWEANVLAHSHKRNGSYAIVR
jgi:glycosyltransferase involved in cell wall biosynthesis